MGLVIGSCAIASFPVTEIQNAANFDRGTDQNMQIHPSLNIDLTGIWWMDGNPLEAEQLVSFAGAANDSSGAATNSSFPIAIPVRNNLARRWTWSDTITGRGVMWYYGLSAEADEPLLFNFQNSTNAKITPVGDVFSGHFGFAK